MNNIKYSGSLLLLSIIATPSVHAAAGDQTLSFGYASVNGGFAHDAYSKNKADYDSHINGVSNLLTHNADSEKDPQGVFVRYRYEFDDTWGVMGAVSYASSSMNNYFEAGKAAEKKKPKEIEKSFSNDIKSQYVSLLVGPTIRANNWVSAFGLVGVAHQKFDNYMHDHAKTPAKEISHSSSSSQTSLAYALGLQFNAYKNFVIDAAWTGTERGNANGFNVGIGYKF